jgi:hypothetical protein
MFDPFGESLLPEVSQTALFGSSVAISALAGLKYYLWSGDDKKASDEDDRAILKVPPDAKPVAKPGAESLKEGIVLPQGFDIKNYHTQELNADRSFIRAFYFIRLKKEPTDEQLNTFVQTDIIKTFKSYEVDNVQRIFNVMHYCGKYEQAPYITFCKIRTEVFKVIDKKLITIKDLLNVSQISDKMLRRLTTTQPKVTVFLSLIEKIRKRNEAFLTLPVKEQQELMDQYAVISNGQPDTDTLDLFKTLSSLISNKQKLYEILVECLKDECKNLSVNSEHNKNNSLYRKFIDSLANNKTKGEVNFPYRCGVGDLLAEAKTKVCVTYIKGEEKQHHNYGCDDRNLVYPNNYIIYMYNNNHHCVLLIPNNLPKTTTTTGVNSAQKAKSFVSPLVPTDACKKYEEEYFSKGGTRKHRKRKQKRGTKSGQKGTKRM